jgi:hypothetical protein
MKYLAIVAAALMLSACNTTLNWNAAARNWSYFEPSFRAPPPPVFVPMPAYQPPPPMTICQRYGKFGNRCY